MIEAMKQALEALELALRSHGVMLLSDPPQDAWKTYGVEGNARQAITSLRQAIKELESQEPVAMEIIYETIIQWDESGGKRSRRELARRIIDLYTHPPQRKPLTDDQILANETLRYHFGLNGGAGPVSKKGRAVIDAIEAAHGIKEES
jgi:hypothetical protein